MKTVEYVSATEGRRADYLWDTKRASAALNVHENRFSDWWYRTRDKLIDLYCHDPGATAAELASLIARGEAERQRRTQLSGTIK